MKRTISFVVALVMCCSLLLPALPAANAMVMDFIWGEPGQTAPERKVSFTILEQMAQAEDDELISVRVHLKRLPRETIEALVPMTKPSNYVNESTQEERDAWAQAEYQTRQRVNGSITRAFIDRYFDEADKPASLGIMDTPSFNCSLNKAKLAALAALDEVIWINEAWTSIYLVQEPAPQEKLTGNLYEYLCSAQEDERIPVRIWLRGFRTEEYEALNPLPYPTFASTPEELAAYRSAAAQASQTVYSDPYGTFVRTRLDENDEVLYQPQMVGVPLVIVKTTPAKIAALAKLRIVSQIDPAFGYDVAFPDPELPENPNDLKKIDQRLREFMRISTHDELIPIAMSLKEPSQAEIDALRTVSLPGGGATIDEMNTYRHDDLQAKRQVYSALTTAFVESHLDENDEVYVRSNYTTSVWASVPKYKIAQLAALEDVTSINWIPEHNDPAYPADGGDAVFMTPEESALSEKIAWPLQVKMTGTADDTPLRVQINLDAPSLRDIDAQMIGKQFSTVDELYAYRETLRQQYMSEASSIYGTFTANYLDEASEQVYQQPDYAYVVATLPKTRIAALAMLDEVTRIEQWHEQDPMELVLPPAEPGVQAKPEKIESDLQREMDGAADDEVIRILLWLNAPSNKEIDATVPPPEDSADPEQVEAYISAAYRARTATKHGIVEAFVQNHMSKTNELLAAGELGPYLLAATTKSRILSLTALDEVQRIERYGIPAFAGDEDPPQVPTVDPKPPVDPEVLKKLSSELVKYMEGKADDAIIPISLRLVSPSSAEIEAMVPIAQPDVYSTVTMEEVNAYIHAKRAVAWEVNSAITTAFVENYLDENDTVRYAGKAIPVVNCDVPKSKILSLAALEEVIQIGYFPNVTLYPTWIRDDSQAAKKLTEPLKAYMEYLADEEPVAIRVDLHMPSEEIMERIVSVPKPGEDASQEEIDAYNEAYRQTWREQVSLRTDGFMHYYVHETDPVYYIGEDDATVICEIPVARLRAAASDQSVIQIDLAGQLADVPAPCEHDYEAVVTAPTCTEGGFTTYTCAKCGDEYVADEVPALGHSFGAWAISKAATCTEKGEQTRACARCDAKETREVAALGHDYQDGVCTHCGEGDPNFVPSPPPTEVDKSQLVKAIEEYTIPPLNYTYETCKAYNDAYDNAIAVNEKEDATQDEVDNAVSALKAALAALKTPDFAALDAAIKAAEEIDRTKYTDESLTAMDQALNAARSFERDTPKQADIDATAKALEDTIIALPEIQHVHDYTAVVTAPTCTAAGYTTHTCACGDSYVDSEVAALGHDYQDGVCTRCAAKDPDYEEPVIEPFRFDDVKDDKQFYYEPVYWAVEKGITKGTSETLFSPDAGCTRGQVVTFLWRAAGEPEPTKTENPFKDVKGTDYFCKAVLWAVEKGITKGTSADRFSPEKTCTRAQIVTFLYRAAGEPELTEKANPFKDVAEGQYYADAVLWAVEKGVTRGRSADAFAPNATCTRGEIVTFLCRAAK